VRQLREVFRHDRRVSIHHRDGYEAIGAFLPPAERRGILFIDPPYEKRSEFDELSQALIKACRRWPSGILAAWYPLKNRPVQIAFKDALRKAKIPECLSIELRLKPEDDFALVGGGMILINPPWQIEEAVRELGSEILQALDAMDGRTSIEWITPPN
jgi:23S rRNA (adenine2030-N6)-methyltransferase